MTSYRRVYLPALYLPALYVVPLLCVSSAFGLYGCSDDAGGTGMDDMTVIAGGSASSPTTGTGSVSMPPSSGSTTAGPVTTGTGPMLTSTMTSSGAATTAGPTTTGVGTGGMMNEGGTGAAGPGAGTGGMTNPGAGGAAGDDASTAGSGGMTIEASLATLELVIMSLGCNGSDCHGGNEFNPLDLRINDDLYTNLTTSVSEECDDLPIVDPGNPEGSALIRLLQGPCGDTMRMPAGCFENEFENNCVPDDYIAAIAQWVADGAPPE